jgi:putative FmdB family regulatory protein
MSDETTDVTCKACGETFTAFLRQMADHNAKVVCPKCGKSYESDAVKSDQGRPAVKNQGQLRGR